MGSPIKGLVKKKISACLITIDEHGQERYEIEEFGTFTTESVRLLDEVISSTFLNIFTYLAIKYPVPVLWTKHDMILAFPYRM